jgi:hypothetical protein
MRERLYNYPSVLTALGGPPTYTKMTETWAGMDVSPAVTTYAVNSNASPQTVDTVYPDPGCNSAAPSGRRRYIPVVRYH